MIAKVSYHVATYSGEVDVFFQDPDADNDHLIALAKKELRRQSGGAPLPFGYQSFSVVSRSDEYPMTRLRDRIADLVIAALVG